MEPNVYSRKISDSQFEYGLIKDFYDVKSYGNLWVDSFQIDRYRIVKTQYIPVGIAETMEESINLRNKLK